MSCARETQEVAEGLQYGETTLRSAIVHYSLAAVAVVAAALWLPRLGAELARDTGLGEAFVGSLFVAVSTSLPEVVVCIAAVRIGALDMAAANLFGSNLFNIAVLGFDDILYRQGPILLAVSRAHMATLSAAILMTGIAIVGLTFRARRKRYRLSWDAMAMVGVYVLSILLLARLD